MKDSEYPKTIKLTIDSRLENVFLTGLATEAFCSYASFGEEAAYQVKLCVVEAVTNAIEHAYKSQPGHEVKVMVSLHLDRITFQVCDTGKSMGPLVKRRLDFDPENLDTLPTEGMGLYIIQSVMDEVAYETVGKNNILSMSKYFEMKRPPPES